MRFPVVISLVVLSVCFWSSENKTCASGCQATADDCRRQDKLPTAYRQQQTANKCSDQCQHAHNDRCTADRMRREFVFRAVPDDHSDTRDGSGHRDSQWDREL